MSPNSWWLLSQSPNYRELPSPEMAQPQICQSCIDGGGKVGGEERTCKPSFTKRREVKGELREKLWRRSLGRWIQMGSEN